MKPTITLIMVLAVAGAACDNVATPDTLPLPDDPDAVVLEVRHEGGFAPIEFVYNPLPAYILLADGRLLYQRPQIDIFPSPMLPSVQQVQLGADGVAQVLDLVQAIGLPDITEEFNNDASAFVADASTTAITYFDAAGSHKFSIYALGITDNRSGRVELAQRLTALLDTLAGTAQTSEPYQVDRLQILVTEAFEHELSVTQPWNLPFAVADTRSVAQGGVRCIALDGTAAQQALSIFAEAHQLTFFEDAGSVLRLIVRPLLPGEAGCP